MVEAKNQTAAEFYSDERHIEMWKIKRLIKKLVNTKGQNTSFVSLYIPVKDSLNKITQKLTEEYSGASSIKSRQTRQSVQSAILATQGRLKMYKNIPINGLVVFCGEIEAAEGKNAKKITMDFEPFKPIVASAYKCQPSFHTEPLEALLEDDDCFGFIVIDGNGILLATLQGENKEVLQRMSVQLPKKHGRGGQSAQRFGRIREEKRHAYVVKCCEMIQTVFISENKPNCRGLVIAGSAQLKQDILDCDKFDFRLRPILLGTLDVSYGMDMGLNQAITLASDMLTNVKFVHEKKIIGKFFENIALDTGLIVFGVEDTMKALELGALDCMMLFENIEVMRYEIKNPVTGEIKIHLLNAIQEQDPKYFKDQETGQDCEVISSEQLADWLCMNYKRYGINIEFITDKSSDGFQFVKGFGGIGGFLRYQIQVDDVAGNAFGHDDFDPDEDFI